MVETQARPETPAALRDLRGWLAAVEAAGELRTIDAPVDPIEEMSAISYLVSKAEDAPAVLFTNVLGAAPGVRSLFGMTGSSRKRLALAMGLQEHEDVLGMVQELRGRLSEGALTRASELTWEHTAVANFEVLAEDALRRRRRG